MKNKDYQIQFQVYLITERKFGVNSYKTYARDIDQFITWMESHNHEIDGISLDILKEFHKSLHKYANIRTRVRKILSVRLFFDFLERKYNKINYAGMITVPKHEPKLPEYFSEHDIKLLIDRVQLDKTPIGIRNKTIVFLLYTTGVRVSELVTLNISDYYDNVLKVTGKGNKQRLIPVNAEMKKHLDKYIKTTLPELTDGYHTTLLFPVVFGNKIKPITRQWIWKMLNNLWQNKSKKIYPHKIRHSYATHLLENGINLRFLQVLLGHESVNTTQVYTHIDKSYARRQYDKKHPRA